MTNQEIAKVFQFLGKIMELHGEPAFKTKSYTNAYLSLKKWPDSIENMNGEEIIKIPGIGKSLRDKIEELIENGIIEELESYKSITPIGIQELLTIRGLGPKKIKQVWRDLEVESPGELLYACKENRLVKLKGFGEKTQEQLKGQLEYFFSSRGKMLFSNAERLSIELLEIIEGLFSEMFTVTGHIYRKLPIIEEIEILTTMDIKISNIHNEIEDLNYNEEKESYSYKNCPVIFIESTIENWGTDLVESSSSLDFLDALGYMGSFEEEDQVFEDMGLAFVTSELREHPDILLEQNRHLLEGLLQVDDIKGVLHNHSTYSDGINTIKEMADSCIEKSYHYLLMSDHSKSAFYANGLQVERVYQQWDEIDMLNKKYSGFKIFKGIESDILNDGSLDYSEDILAGFDVVIGSIHSNLRMDISKATQRLITAIENPYLRILGHPTGRILLSREGYPLNHKKIIEACAANNVVIELNANPHRLDLDWTWIPYAIEQGVDIAINPDAHSVIGIDDIYYGVCVARKAALQSINCLNVRSIESFEQWIADK